MKKPLKITVTSLAVLLILIVAASLLVRSYLTEERMRALVSEMMERSLDRKVVLGEIKVSLFSGIVVKNLEIREKDSEADFIKTKEFVLKYQLLPLLAKKLVIDKLSLVDAEIHLATYPDGTHNFSDMVRPGRIEGREGERGKPAGLPVSLNVKNIAVRNVRLSYADTAGRPQKADAVVNAELGISSLTKNELTSEGTIGGTLFEALFKDKTFKNINANVRYKIAVDMEAMQIKVHSIDVDTLKTHVNIKGIVNYASGLEYSLDVKVPGLDLSGIRSDIYTAFLPEGMILGGNVSMLISIIKKHGREGPPVIEGNVNMAMVSCAYKSTYFVLNGSLKLRPEMITLEGVNLITGRDSADISGSIRNYLEYPDLNIDIKSKAIDCGDLFRTASPPAKSQEAVKGHENKESRAYGKGGGVNEEPGPMDVKLKVNASLDIDKTRCKGVSLTNLRARCELKDNVLTIPYLKGNTLSGAFTVKAAVDLTRKGTRYVLTSDVSNVRIEEMIDVFAPKARGKLFGALSGKAEVTGSGMLPANVKRNLKGKGSFALKDGSLRNAQLSAGLLAILGLQELGEIPIERANGRFTIAGGVVNLKTLISSKNIKIDETGTIGMDEKLNLGVLVKVSERLTPRLVNQSSITSFLSGEKGWTGLPLRVGGTISNPSYAVDTAALARQVRRGMQKKVGEELFKLFP